MEQSKKTTFTKVAGTALLTTALLFPGCESAKPKNKQHEPSEQEAVTEVVQLQQPVPPAVQQGSALEAVQQPEPPDKTVRSSSKSRFLQREQKIITQQGELPPGWTPEKCETLVQLRAQRTHTNASANSGKLCDIDPILIGDNVVFGTEWLKFIGNDKPLTRQQFEAWRDKTDIIYNRYVDLIGSTPISGKKVFIDLMKGVSSAPTATAYPGLITFNGSSSAMRVILKEVAEQNSWSHVMLHEMAHIFAEKRMWEVDVESIADLLTSYVMETTRGAQYGTPGQRGVALQKTVGDQYRKLRYNRALGNLDKMEAFNTSGGNGFDFLTLGVVDEVGWDTFKKVFRSYDDKDFKPNEYKGDINRMILTLDFFDRIEFFGGKPEILRNLPDEKTSKTKVIDRLFRDKAELVQRNIPLTSTAQKDTSTQQEPRTAGR